MKPAYYQAAINIQDACNLSGVVYQFAAVLERLWEVASKNGKGTDWVNNHPICVLHSSKIASLTRSECSAVFSQAYAICSDEAEKGKE